MTPTTWPKASSKPWLKASTPPPASTPAFKAFRAPRAPSKISAAQPSLNRSIINAPLNTPPRVGIVDYGSGNLRSAFKAAERCGGACTYVTTPAELEPCDAVIVPGQGSFGDCARNLRESGLWEPIQSWIAADRPFLGICVGYQLLFESSEESPDVPGLGVFPGTVRHFPPTELKIPHMGWNQLEVKATDRLYRGLTDPVEVYFVHSYYPVPADDCIVSATCNYGIGFAASVSRGNLSATQFHPEKSQATGLAILRNFISSIQSRAMRDSLSDQNPLQRGNPNSKI